jgi:cytochrome P450
VARTPLHRDETLGLWVAASAPVVTAVMSHPACRVRPAAEPVPNALVGSPAGDVFGRLVRMNDGAGHSPMKQAVAASLAALDARRIADYSDAWARQLADELDPRRHPDRVTELAFRLPVYVVASALGVPAQALPQTAAWMRDFVRCLAPSSTAEQIEAGKAAAGRLIDMLRPLITTSSDDSLARHLAREATRLGRDDHDVVVANALGFMSQAYEATAGLIGNAIVTLGRWPAVRSAVVADPGALSGVIREVVRHDAPVQNTRRFVATDDIVAEQPVKAGDAILVVLAAANRDPSVNPDPDRFDAGRTARQAFTFGVGVHACPGEALATEIARAGVGAVLAAGIEPSTLLDGLTYRPSANTRIPLFRGEW